MRLGKSVSPAGPVGRCDIYPTAHYYSLPRILHRIPGNLYLQPLSGLKLHLQPKGKIASDYTRRAHLLIAVW